MPNSGHGRRPDAKAGSSVRQSPVIASSPMIVPTGTFDGDFPRMTTDHSDISAGADSSDTDRASLIRLVTLVVGSVEIIAFVLLAHLTLHSGDPLGATTAEGTLLATAPLVALTLPGVLLAWLGRAKWTAFGMVLAGMPLAAAAWMLA